jgi:hypothetical protein
VLGQDFAGCLVCDHHGLFVNQHQNINSSMGNSDAKVMHFVGPSKRQLPEPIDFVEINLDPDRFVSF